MGSALLEAAITWARDRHASQIELWVTQGNEAAANLYRRAGFASTGQEDVLRPGSVVRIQQMVHKLGI